MSSLTLDVSQWAQQQFQTCEFGDKRRTKRMVKLATQVATKPDAATPEQTENWADCNLCSVSRRGNFPAFSGRAGERLRQPVGPRVLAQQPNDRALRLGQLGHHHLGLPLTDPKLVPLDR